MAANKVDEWNVRGAFPNDLSLSLVEKSRHTERTTTNTNLQKTKNNDLKTTSERTSAYTSECQISPKFSRTLAYAGPIRYSVTGPLVWSVPIQNGMQHNSQ